MIRPFLCFIAGALLMLVGIASVTGSPIDEAWPWHWLSFFSGLPPVLGVIFIAAGAGVFLYGMKLGHDG